MSETPPPEFGSLGSSIALSFLSLGLVCLVAYVCLRWLSRRGAPAFTGPLKVHARQALDPKRSVFVLEAAERCFLVGAGDGSMTLLAELDRDKVIREIGARAAAAKAAAPFGRFADVLTRALSRPKPIGPVPAREDEAPSAGSAGA